MGVGVDSGCLGHGAYEIIMRVSCFGFRAFRVRAFRFVLFGFRVWVRGLGFGFRDFVGYLKGPRPESY